VGCRANAPHRQQTHSLFQGSGLYIYAAKLKTLKTCHPAKISSGVSIRTGLRTQSHFCKGKKAIVPLFRNDKLGYESEGWQALKTMTKKATKGTTTHIINNQGIVFAIACKTLGSEVSSCMIPFIDNFVIIFNSSLWNMPFHNGAIGVNRGIFCILRYHILSPASEIFAKDHAA
jgi:hypothetical protein